MALEAAGLTAAIEAAFGKEWALVKTIPLPGAGREDRRLLFAAVARGILEYLNAHENETVTTVTLEETGSSTGTTKVYSVREIDLNIAVDS